MVPAIKKVFELLLRGKYIRDIAQAVSVPLPTSTELVRALVKSCGIFRGQRVTGAGDLPALLFPCHILIPIIAPFS
jgi:hypothetical protein